MNRHIDTILLSLGAVFFLKPVMSFPRYVQQTFPRTLCLLLTRLKKKKADYFIKEKKEKLRAKKLDESYAL